MKYVYLIRSVSAPDQRYIGVTSNLEERLRTHNIGGSPHTSKYTPWELVSYMCFADDQRALEFERYLKSGSGRAFANKRLWSPSFGESRHRGQPERTSFRPPESAHTWAAHAENVAGGPSGELLVLQRLAKVLAPDRRELVDSEIAECGLQMKTDDGLIATQNFLFDRWDARSKELGQAILERAIVDKGAQLSEVLSTGQQLVW